MSTELPLGQDLYQIGRLPALSQFHVTRRVAPILANMGVSVIDSLRTTGELSDEDMVSVMGTAAEVVAKMSDADVEYVIFTCLSVVRKKQEDVWAAVVNGKQFMFQTMDMQLMMRLTVAVLKENLSGFFQPLTGATGTSKG